MSKATKATAARLPDAYLLCRLHRHQFGPARMDFGDDPPKVGWGTPIAWDCQRCGAVRIDVIDKRGELSWRQYQYPEGYTVEQRRRPNAPTLRLEFIARARQGRTPQ